MAKCIGCGIKLQTHDESLPGYVPLLVSADLGDNVYCKRCYQIIHNGKKYDPEISDNDYYSKISCIKDQKVIVVLMIDIMDIYGGFIPNLHKYIGDNQVIIAVNKVDIMPKDVHLKKIEERIRGIAAKEKLDVLSVIMISAKKKQNIESVLNKIFKLKENAIKKSRSYRERRLNKIRDCYILGCASVGKSTFINAIKEKYLDDKKLITTSDQFQTTMDFIKVYIDEDNYIIDTPGLINYRSFGAYLDYESMKVLTPKSYLKPKTYQLNPDQTIFMGALARLDFIKGDKINASFYTSNDLYIHRTKTINATNIYETQKTKLLVPPYSLEELNRLSETKEVMFNIEDGAYDLLISGLGFVHIVGANITFKVTVHKNIDVRLVETFI